MGPGPTRKAALVEMITWSRRPLIAWPRISSAMPARVDVGRVEHGQAGVEADVDEPRGLGHVALAPRLEGSLPAERARPEAQDRDLESGASELAIFHGGSAVGCSDEDRSIATSGPGRRGIVGGGFRIADATGDRHGACGTRSIPWSWK